MVQSLEVVKDLSRRIKSGEPIVLSSFEAEPADPGSPDVVYQAIIRDVLRRRDAGKLQAFSGVSDDAITSAELQ